MRSIKIAAILITLISATTAIADGYMKRMPDGSYSSSDGTYSKRMPDGSYSNSDGTYNKRMPDGSYTR